MKEMVFKHELLSVPDTALYLGVSERSVYRYIQQGKLKSFTDGGQISVTRSSLRHVTPNKARITAKDLIRIEEKIDWIIEHLETKR